jgi:hypothetical protein
VAEQPGARHAEVPPDRLEILDEALGTERHRVGDEGGVARAPLVVEDQRVSCGQRRQVVGEVGQAQPWPAVQHDDGVGGGAEHPVEQAHPGTRVDVALPL